jgi:DeoR/GlpR family transcriptional regulator of sugar metabolism
MLPKMLADMKSVNDIGPDMTRELRDSLSRAIGDAFESRDVFTEADQFAQKLASRRAGKRAIAAYIYTRFLKDLRDGADEIVLDSGTVTYTVCEKLVDEACCVRMVTNNLAAARLLSQIPNYPCFILPGTLESRYWASLGKETEKYLSERVKGGRIKYGIIAATSFSAATGIAGNDPRHASFKARMLDHCPTLIIAFEGEKILRAEGSPILQGRGRAEDSDIVKQWREIMAEKDIHIVTHFPEDWSLLRDAERALFNKTIADIVKVLGSRNVKVLGSSKRMPGGAQ